MKRFFRWVYDWITVLTASLVGLPTVLLQFLSFFAGVDLTPFVGPEMALQIVCGVALLKGVLAWVESMLAKKGDA